eukprot:scaffold2294_cov106-Cylindrotheca_fusiformis.AAC.2
MSCRYDTYGTTLAYMLCTHAQRCHFYLEATGSKIFEKIFWCLVITRHRTRKRRNNEQWQRPLLKGKFTRVRPEWSEGCLANLRKIALAVDIQPIFNQNLEDPSDNDNLRTMIRKFPRESHAEAWEKNAIGELWKVCDSIATAINRKWSTYGLAVVRAEKGCQKAVHSVGAGDGTEIGGLIVAVQDGTKYHFHGGKEALELRIGDAIAFHGSIPQCGAAYDERNVHFFAYIAEDKTHLPNDKVGKWNWSCEKCTKGFDTKKSMKRHVCKAEPPEKHELKRKRNRERQRKHRQNKKKSLNQESTSSGNEHKQP